MSWIDQLKEFDAGRLCAVDPAELAAPFGDAVEPDVKGEEVDTARRLPSDRALIRRATARTTVDFRANPDALRHLATLPKKGESLHGIICGKYALWDLVPAVLERTGKTIDHLSIATLSYSEKNAADLLARFDAGQIKGVSLLVSHYFKSTSQGIYEALVPHLLARGQRVLAMRTHCKILLFRIGGTRYVVESSANLRSCVNVEQFVMTNDRKLYDFHHAWLEQELIGGHRAARA